MSYLAVITAFLVPDCYYADCHYDEWILPTDCNNGCHFHECHCVKGHIMQNVIMMSAFMPSDIIPKNHYCECPFKLIVIMTSIFYRVTKYQRIIMLSVIMMRVILC